MKEIKQRIFEIIQVGNNKDTLSKLFDFTIIFLIIVNVSTTIFYTFDLSSKWNELFVYIETFSVLVFTIEYLLRIWTANLLYPCMSPFRARIRYLFSFMALVDLAAILPFYIYLFVPLDLRDLRAIRALRLLMLLKVNRYFYSLATIGQVLKKKSDQLISAIFVVFILMLISSVLMYNVENSAQPDVFKNAFSGLWWAATTFTTVGYGDIYPMTITGKILGSLIALLGIGLVAVPTGIISAGFIETTKNKKEDNLEKNEYCPYCGKKLP